MLFWKNGESRYYYTVNTLFLIFFLVLGAIIGSFLNVVIFRFNTGRGIGGRSRCFSCRRVLTPIDLVPVLSYLVFQGCCRTCKSRISFQYPAVELLTALLFVGVYILYASLFLVNPPLFLFKVAAGLVVMSLLVLITVYDVRHKIIPDTFAFTFAVIAFVLMFIGVGADGMFFLQIPLLPNLFAGIILAFPFYFLWLISRGAWMGLGDAKLALGIGWFLGLSGGATAIIYGFWIGAAVSVFLLIIQKLSRSRWSHLSMKSEIPFAPFLILGLLIVYFFQYNMFSVLQYV